MVLKKYILSVFCSALLVGGLSCQSKTAQAQTSDENVECFAKVKAFDNAKALQDFILENGIKEVVACSDAISQDRSQSFLVIPGKNEIKLYIHQAEKDEYGNVMPKDEAMLGYGEVGQPISFVSNFEGNDCPVVVEAVDGVGRRAYWSPAFDAAGNLVTDSDFIPLGKVQATVADTPQEAGKNVKDQVDMPEIGMKALLVDGEVFIQIYEIQKFKDRFASLPFFTPLNNERYPLEKMSGKCTGLLVGDIGQNYNPVLCMLMEGGGVEILDIYNAVAFGEFMTSGLLDGFDNIVDFATGGGGEYEMDGKVCYSYTTVYAIDDKGEKKEITYNPVCQTQLYENNNNEIIRMTPDGKIFIMVEPYGAPCFQYIGRYTLTEIGNDYNLFDVKYHLLVKEHLEDFENGKDKISLLGSFQLSTADYDCLHITPNSGLDFGATYGEKVDFKRVQTEED